MKKRQPSVRYATRGVGAVPKSRKSQGSAAKRRENLAYGYVRVSTEEQAREGYSIDAQKRRLEQYAKAKDWELVKTYIDDGYSARTLKRPAYEQLMGTLGESNILLVWKIDRLHRNSRNFARMIDKFNDTGINFCSINESWDTSTATGRFAMDLIVRIAQLESEQTGERVLEAMSEKAHQGEYKLGQRAPYGYEWTEGDAQHGTGEWVINKDEADTVKWIYEQYANHKGHDWSTIKIAQHLGWCTCFIDGERQRTSCAGCKKVRYILNNGTYVGYYLWNGEYHKGTHKPIISRELFDKAQARRWYYAVQLPPE